MSDQLIQVVKGARPGEKFQLEVSCIREEGADENELTLFLSKEGEGLSFIEKYFKISRIDKVK
jgi:hypothetical protein